MLSATGRIKLGAIRELLKSGHVHGSVSHSPDATKKHTQRPGPVAFFGSVRAISLPMLQTTHFLLATSLNKEHRSN
jgi:hypothetical protein